MKFAILGPTASGKSALSVELARRIGGTVVNGDPFQSIAGLEIGTGQPGDRERADVPHAGYGCFPPQHRPDPSSFGACVREWLAGSAHPVLVTGSGLYLRGIWNQLSALPPVPAGTVARVRDWTARLGAPALHRWLAAVDPVRAAQLHPNDGARIQRALALHLATGRRASGLLDGVREGIPSGWRALLVLPERAALRRRIEVRVAAQIAAGWPAEVARLLAAGHQADLEALRPLGYAEWIGGGDPRRLQERIVRATQAYAKRQTTFFRNQWPEVPAWDPDRQTIDAACSLLGL
jgi:tRNA dimethylallyltransferase